MNIRILSGELKGRVIKSPQLGTTRPITSFLKKSMFDTCQPIIGSARIVDLFAGSGSIGIEGISRGASFCLFIDLEPKSVQTIKENLKALDITSQGIAVKQDAFKWLEIYSGEPFNILFIDPPYPIGLAGYKNIITLILANHTLLYPESHIFLEAPSQIKQPIRELLLPHFQILKEKTSTTTTLFYLKELAS